MNDDKQINNLNPYNPKNKPISKKDIYNIVKKCGIKKFNINNLSIYQKAFTHKSYVLGKVKNYLEKNNIDFNSLERPDGTMKLQNDSNERLEFLGDAIISSVIVSYLYRRYYDANEGFMTKLKTRLVRTEALGKFALAIGLDRYLVISDYVESKCDGRKNIRILEDLFESFIGALFLDQSDNIKPEGLLYGPGYSFCETFIIKLIEKLVDFEDLIMNDENYKDILLRYFQQHYGKPPNYIQLSESGPTNNRSFTMGVNDINGNIIGKATDVTKKKAEQLASKNALEYLKNSENKTN